jgi:hypothetical protein
MDDLTEDDVVTTLVSMLGWMDTGTGTAPRFVGGVMDSWHASLQQ